MDSFLDFNPTIAVILNIEMDHVDYFHSLEQIKNSYRAYAALTGKDGCAVANFDDENVISALSDFDGKIFSFGIKNEKSDFVAYNIENKNGFYTFDVKLCGEHFCHVELSVTGYHNIYNALAATAAAYVCGIPAEEIEKGLHLFRGAMRRMEFKGRIGGADIYDDYGHHPTEVRSTLEGASRLAHARGGRLLCAFQSHTYTRTKEFLYDFASSFDAADRVFLVDIYSARETDTLGVSSALLASLIGERARYTGGFCETAYAVLEEIKPNDVVIIMGAGDIYKIFDYFSDKYE
jgi:UDP-N-acetylmuramate--alanine ligase